MEEVLQPQFLGESFRRGGLITRGVVSSGTSRKFAPGVWTERSRAGELVRIGLRKWVIVLSQRRGRRGQKRGGAD